MKLDLLIFCQIVLIGLKLCGVITYSWWAVLLPTLAIPVWLIVYCIVFNVLFELWIYLLRRLR